MPRWRANGSELYYVAADSRLMAVPIRMSDRDVTPSVPTALFQTRISVATISRTSYAAAPDGRFLMTTSVGDAGVSPITRLLNWSGLR